MAWNRALAIKAALVAVFLLLLINVLFPRIDEKYEKSPSMTIVQKAGSLQWPKRTRSSTIMNQINKNATNINNNNNSQTIPLKVTQTPIVSTNVVPVLNNKNNISYSNSSSVSGNISSSSSNISSIENTNGNLNNPIAGVTSVINDTAPSNKSIDETFQQTNLTINPIKDISKNNNNNNISRNNSNSNKVEYEDSSTKSNFLQNIMTTLGLNNCPAIPPNLEGPVEPDLNYHSMAEVEKFLGPKLLPGGWFRPHECNARDRVAILVPYRDRPQHLPIFLNNLHPFLMKQQIEYGIFIVEQTEGTPFNRAALFNVGFVEALKLSNWDCFIFHDIDLIPLDDRNLYTCPDQPRHMSVAENTHNFKLPYSTIFGGVSAMTVKQFQTVNGFSNVYWGWGAEDDDMSNRLKHAGFHIARYPVNIARYTMLTHKKEKANPKRHELLQTNKNKYEVEGLNSLHYKLKELKKLPLYTRVLTELSQEKTS